MYNGNMRGHPLTHLCACGCGQPVPRLPNDEPRKYRRRRYASPACRARGADDRRPKQPCARPGCDVLFAPRRHDHRYCSGMCQDLASAGREPLDPAKGGLLADGGLVSGTDWGRADIDVWNPPADDARFW